MADGNPAGLRAARLQKSFRDFLLGRISIKTEHEGKLFLEAICSQQSPPMCVERIIASAHGLESIQRGVRVSIGARFISMNVIPFLNYISHSDVKSLCEGDFLERILSAVVEPPTVWKAMLQLFRQDGFLNGQSDAATFAWLCLEVVRSSRQDLAAASNDLVALWDQLAFMKHSCYAVREAGYRIQKIIQIKSSGNRGTAEINDPGGRHDNDFSDYRKISVFPTSDEFASSQQSFYRTALEVERSAPEERTQAHLDNQFRLLREDMLSELREDVQTALGRKKSHRRVQKLGNLSPVGIDSGDEYRGRKCALMVRIRSGLEFMQNKANEQRIKYLKDNYSLLKNQSFGALYSQQEVIGFAYLFRDIDKLAQVPVVELRFTTTDDLSRALAVFEKNREVDFVLVDTPVFAYEPVLERLKCIIELPFEAQLLGPCTEKDSTSADEDFVPSPGIQDVIEACRESAEGSLCLRVGDCTYKVDDAQCDALVNILQHSVSVTLGPPGTGKSFLGALAVKILLLTNPTARVLVLAYTNHALDQFLNDLLAIDIRPDIMTRLGFRASESVAPLSIESQFQNSDIRKSSRINARSNQARDNIKELHASMHLKFKKWTTWPTLKEVLEHLEFCHEEQDQLCFRAFTVPSPEEQVLGAVRKSGMINPEYLIDRWLDGKGPGALSRNVSRSCASVWSIPRATRSSFESRWMNSIFQERREHLLSDVRKIDALQLEVDRLLDEAKCAFVRTKQIIGCTTTAAAKYPGLVKAANPDCVLVEEAGEILEAHVLAALGPDVKQLILIGDHKQLRPKCKNYALSVEKGDGYDLNRSLFERLILHKYPHTVLRNQHRMDPSISQLVRSLTYPDLLDDIETLDRPATRGLTSKVMFVNHGHPEGSVERFKDAQDDQDTNSKQNEFEARMVLQTVKYLGQQGYKTQDIVVLTPYLGQLRLLRDMLGRDNDPLLSDLDSNELVRAGLLTDAAAKVGKSKIRLSTIDNYQGEESDIVIASLTRSNAKGDIGFMKAPQRLNVLLSRARNCLIMYGNMDTFMASTRGSDCWVPFFDLLKKKGFLRDGLEVRCEQHPERRALLASPEDFDSKCPDGGCSEICHATLTCGQHACARRCHRLADHSSVPCSEVLQRTCSKQHDYEIKCSEQHDGCPKCRKEEEEIRRRAKRDLDLETACRRRQEEYQRELQAIQDELSHEKRLLKDERDKAEEQRILQQHRDDLAGFKETVKRHDAIKNIEEEVQRSHAESTPDCQKDQVGDVEPGSARDEWEQMKREELAQSDLLDKLMGMIGLESVKRQFLEVKTAVDTAVRQGISTRKERFGCSLLGNPGTGKTTVARLYAQFLTSVGVLAGSRFEETTGSKLANMGVSGCQKLLDNMLEAGGGVVFIDEAYQLSSGNHSGGKAVLDFLLAEVENLTGKVCFVLAGYAKQMESFFSHNPGFPSRFPLEMKFEDYTDDELLRILERQIDRRYSGRMKVEDGSRGLYCRIVARRLGRARGREGFGNARAVENRLAAISRRQGQRLKVQRRAKQKPDDFQLTKEDLIGPEPSRALVYCQAWVELQELIGLGAVKESVKVLVDSIQANYHRELNEEPVIEYNLNRVFVGNPGTGKTTVAKLYGRILVDLGLLSNGEVIVKNPSDFVGAVLGESEQKTKAILAATAGKVLVIDEAYGLYGSTDPYKTAVVDTIVSTVHSTPGDDRCVLLLGYFDQMEEMFRNVNPGLSRRFPLSAAFVFEDFTQSQLAEILSLKLKQQGFAVTKTAEQVALDMLDRARNRPNFGNAGEIDILLNDAKSRHQSRLSAGKTKRISVLEAVDFDEDHDRVQRSETNVAELFSGTVGCENVVKTLQGYQDTVRGMLSLGMDPRDTIPFTFLFRGPPGTGKSTTARKMGKVFYDMGFLSSAQVLDCSASELIGSYVGHTGPKVQSMLDKALGQVLLVDEAYRLAEGAFAKEALDELVDAITKPKYRKRLIIILAGYVDDMNRLLKVNPGLSSRFPEVIDFRSLDATECYDLLVARLSGKEELLQREGKGVLDASCLKKPSESFQRDVYGRLDTLSQQPGWASARDVETLAESMFQTAVKSLALGTGSRTVVITETTVKNELMKMLKERQDRARQAAPSKQAQDILDLVMASVEEKSLPSQPRPSQPRKYHVVQAVSSAARQAGKDGADDEEANDPMSGMPIKLGVRDAGVSDEVWIQLQQDAEAEARRREEYETKKLQAKSTTDETLHESIIKELIEEEERRKKEAEMKKKLEKQGRCPVGYEWIRQATGWRCAGGGHFVSEMEFDAGNRADEVWQFV
ncbi:hypothetical protein E4U42_007121 [Claviceps africana]|uniref:AAA+ ATPase domain-containing protein n=1 Tax=Claviceps africana TaxID=83212 RepID=A0A8K0J1G2_9HYPO|nr:hypothetical protein E4U42_007121 [Claviceps africana]